MMPALTDRVRAAEPRLISLRRALHGRPELAFGESETSALIARHLSEAGLAVRSEVGRTGVIGTLDSGQAGPTLMIRADIDGLPVREMTGLPFASRNGAMHACGHDGHIAIAVIAAEILATHRNELRGRAVFVFQPAEEITQGAMAMIDDGALSDARPDRVIGLHLWNQLETGRVAVNRGVVFASADAIRLSIRGRGGHGALPHLSVDPVVVAAQIITSLQTVISRELPPNEMGVLTFGQIHAGSAPNVIADTVVLEGTVRAYSREVRQQILDAVPRLAKAAATGSRAEAEFEWMYGSPPVVNDPEVAQFMAGHAEAVVGPDHVGEAAPVSVGDDMAEFLNRVPGCYFLLGAHQEGAEPHHNARFDFDERCLPIGVEILTRAAVDYLA